MSFGEKAGKVMVFRLRGAVEMGSYQARKVKVEVYRKRDFVEIGGEKREVIVKQGLKFDENGRWIK